MKSKNVLLILFSLILISTFASAVTTVAVVQPNGGETLNRQGNNPYAVTWTISGSDANYFLIDMNYSTSTSQGTGTVIINDLNTSNSAITCNDVNRIFTGTVTCSYNWNFSGVANGNYYIFVDANNGNAFDRSNATFTVTSFYVQRYTGADLGTIFLDLFGIILSTLARNAGTIIVLFVLGFAAVIFREDFKHIFDMIKGVR